MKTNIKKIATVICFAASFFSCKKNIEVSKSLPSDVKKENSSLAAKHFKVDINKFVGTLRPSIANRSIEDGDSVILANLSEFLDSIGSWHNQFQQHMYVNTVEDGLSLCGEDPKLEFQQKYTEYSFGYFSSVGIDFSSDFFEFVHEENLENWELESLYNFSPEGNQLLSSLFEKIDIVDDLEVSEFVAICDSLKDECFEQGLPIDEVIAIGSGITTAKYSALYWGEHFTEWESYYSGMECAPNHSNKLSSTEKRVLGADAVGAVQGAIWGGLGGIAGSLAGALVCGGARSCTSAICAGFGIPSITSFFGF